MSTAKTTSFVKVASTSEIPLGIMKKVMFEDAEVLLANIDGKYYAIGNVCTHVGGPLDEGTMDHFEVQCPWHGSRFDLRNGEVKHGPAQSSEPSYEVKVEGSDLLIRVK